MITGSSMHNQRIERLWRDLFRGAIKLYTIDCSITLKIKEFYCQQIHSIFMPYIMSICHKLTKLWTSSVTGEYIYMYVEENDGVQLPQWTFLLHDDYFALLQQSVTPLDNSDNYGIELYEQTLEFISIAVRQNPSLYNS